MARVEALLAMKEADRVAWRDRHRAVAHELNKRAEVVRHRAEAAAAAGDVDARNAHVTELVRGHAFYPGSRQLMGAA